MPYNTRRKSLSLESLGIHVPSSSRAAHRSPPSMTPVSEDQRPKKKIKRSSTSSISDATSLLSLSKGPYIKLEHRPLKGERTIENTPPPSPGCESPAPPKVDIQGIDDEIVVGVVQQLEKTGNRPHLLKELAAVLGTQLAIVQSSANPAAIISSRLMNYLKRNCWSPLAPCPLARTLVGTHPKRIYFYLTTSQHQPIPDKPESAPAIAARIITPSLSSADNEESHDEMEGRERARMSPSPEIDLSSPEFEDVGTPFSEHLSIHSHPASASNMSHNRRAQSPPLEKEEREFTQIHTALQQRSRSQSAAMAVGKAAENAASTPMDVSMDLAAQETEETEESAARKNSEAAAVLFGHLADCHVPVQSVEVGYINNSIPRPLKRSADDDLIRDDDTPFDWAELGNPESVELDELDDLFGAY